MSTAWWTFCFPEPPASRKPDRHMLSNQGHMAPLYGSPWPRVVPGDSPLPLLAGAGQYQVARAEPTAAPGPVCVLQPLPCRGLALTRTRSAARPPAGPTRRTSGCSGRCTPGRAVAK